MQYLHPEIQCCGLILRDLEIPALRHLAYGGTLRCADTRSRAMWRYTLQQPPPVI